jgi:hypothetical protein
LKQNIFACIQIKTILNKITLPYFKMESLQEEIRFKQIRNSTPEKYYKIQEDPKFLLERLVFDIDENLYLEYESKRLEILKEEIFRDKSLIKKLKENKFLKEFFDNEILNKTSESLRYLNIFGYDVDLCLNHFHKMLEIFKKMKINFNPKNLSLDAMMDCIIRSDIFFILGKDKKKRPIIVFDLNKLEQFNVKKMNPLDLLKSITYFLNKVIIKQTESGKIEQFIIFLNLKNLSQGGLIENYCEIIKLIQYIFPSRLHKLYTSICSQASNETFMHVQKSIFDRNKSKIRVFDKKILNKLNENIDKNLLEGYFFHLNGSYSLQKEPIEKLSPKFSLEKTSNNAINHNNNNFRGYENENINSTLKFDNCLSNNLSNNFSKDICSEDFNFKPLIAENSSRFSICVEKEFDTNHELSLCKNLFNINSSQQHPTFLKVENCNIFTIVNTCPANQLSTLSNSRSNHHERSYSGKNLKKMVGEIIYETTEGSEKIEKVKSMHDVARIRKKQEVIFETESKKVCCSDDIVCVIF